MSGLLTVNGGYNGTNGLLPVPTNFTAALGDSSIATALQTYLNAVSTSLPAGGAMSGGNPAFLIGFENDDVAAGTAYSVSGSGPGALVDITNTDTTGATVASANVNLTVPSITTTLVVQDPARVSITGSDSTTLAVFGGSSSVHYSVTGGQGSIFAGGGRDIIGIYSAGTNSNVDLVSSGNDSINLNGTGNDTVTAVGNASTGVLIGAASATVTATGNSTVNVTFDTNAGGDLDFINNSSNAATVYTGSFGPGVFAPNSVTVFGGGAGGVYVGGRAGNNSLIGGTGLTTLIGGGGNDVLSVTASVGAAYNELYTGQGFESLLAGAGSGNNAFNIGLEDFGVGNVTASGIASSDGSGAQAFDIGNTNGETITGSSVAGSTNAFDVVGDSTTGGGNFTINDFNSANSSIYLVDGTTQAPSDASISSIGTFAGSTLIALSDGTQITLKNYTGALTTTTGSTGTIIT
jgi:hypothetical protein